MYYHEVKMSRFNMTKIKAIEISKQDKWLCNEQMILIF